MPSSGSHTYLVRHAKAEHDHARGDAARRLTPAGRDAFHALVASLRGRLQVRRILSSPFTRALQTAQVLSELTGAPVEEEAALASGASTGREILTLARRAGPGVALVGHNPEMAEAVALAAGHERKVRPGTIAAIPGDGATPLAWIEAPERTD